MSPNNLLRCINHNQAAADFDLGMMQADGGCLFSNDMVACGRSSMLADSLDFLEEAQKEYGITRYEAIYLFWHRDFVKSKIGMLLDLWDGKARSRFDVDAATNRIQKFVIYKTKKNAILYNEDGSVRESARRTVGDLGITISAMRGE